MRYLNITLLILCSKLSGCNSKSFTEETRDTLVTPVERSLDAPQNTPAVDMTQIMLRLQTHFVLQTTLKR